MHKVVIATTNEKKKRELKAFLKGLKAKMLALNDLDMHVPRVVENGTTFRQNAIKKALTFSRYIDGIILADDSGLMVDALGGKPGVRSARFAHPKATDGENNSKLLKLLRDRPERERKATFVCVVAIAKKGNLIDAVEGRCEGALGTAPKGRNGFGYDPLFRPKGYDKTFAEMTGAQKSRISHRGIALRKARNILEIILK